MIVKSHGASLFSLYTANTIHDLLIMHACDTFCDELILLHNYVILIRCNYFTVNTYPQKSEEVGYTLSAAKNNLLFYVYYDYYYGDV